MQAEETAGAWSANSRTQLNTYFIELEGLLERVGSAVTCYQTLGIEPAATRDHIRLMYLQALELLFPPDEIRDALPADTLARLDESLEKLTRAFARLGSAARRSEYDQELQSGRGEASVRSRPAAAAAAVSGKAFSSEPVQAESDNRRRYQRGRLRLPVQVIGHDRRCGEWEELTETTDVSATGVMITLHQQVRLGAVLHLSLPLPQSLRSGDQTGDDWKVYAIVRRIRPEPDGGHRVGLEYLGPEPPQGYRETPWAAFRTLSWEGANRRRHERVARSETVFLEYLDERGTAVLLDTGQMENISRHGLRIRVSPVTARFETVRISSWDRHATYTALVVDRFAGADGDERLCLHLPDREFRF